MISRRSVRDICKYFERANGQGNDVIICYDKNILGRKKKVGRESHLLEEELSHFLLNMMSALRYFKNNHSSTPKCVGRALVLFLIEKYTDTFLQKVMPS